VKEVDGSRGLKASVDHRRFKLDTGSVRAPASGQAQAGHGEALIPAMLSSMVKAGGSLKGESPDFSGLSMESDSLLKSL